VAQEPLIRVTLAALDQVLMELFILAAAAAAQVQPVQLAAQHEEMVVMA